MLEATRSYGFSSSHVWMWELDHEEGRVPKNWCFWTVVLEKTLESPLDCKEIQPVNLKEISPEYSLERLMLKPQYFGHLMWGPDSLEKTLMLGKIEEQEDKGMTEDEMAGWYHHFNGHEFDQTLGDSEEQGSLTCCSPWGGKQSDTTEWLNNNRVLTAQISQWLHYESALWISLCHTFNNSCLSFYYVSGTVLESKIIKAFPAVEDHLDKPLVFTEAQRGGRTYPSDAASHWQCQI